MNNYIFSFIIIVIIAILQLYFFCPTKRKIKTYKNIFSRHSKNYSLLVDNNSLEINVQNHSNSTLNTIIRSINIYLKNNKGAVSDYHLIKDIVERNCAATEEEIQSQIPIPIFFGLIGTMVGILYGLIDLVFISDWLSELLNSYSATVNSKGLEALLGGVGLAMVTSIVGVTLNIISTSSYREANTEVEKNKNKFLSWIQAELLPNIATDPSAALVKMTQNLAQFNESFAENTSNLHHTLEFVHKSYQKQSELIDRLDKLKITEIANANIDIYEKLKNSTEEIGVFAEYMSMANQYIASINEIWIKLDNYENRTQIIEKAGNFYSKNEKWLADNIDGANLEVQSAIGRFKEIMENHASKLDDSLNQQVLQYNDHVNQQRMQLATELTSTSELILSSFTTSNDAFINSITKQQERFEDYLKSTNSFVANFLNETKEIIKQSINEQQNLLETKVDEFTELTDEIKHLASVKNSMVDFKNIIQTQNTRIFELTNELKKFAQKNSDVETSQNLGIPTWLKIVVSVSGGLFIIGSLLYIIPRIIEYINIIIN